MLSAIKYLAAVTLCSSVALSQVVIPPHSAIYNGYSRGFNFTAQTPFNIVQLELPLDAFQAGDTAGFLVRINGTTALHSVGNAGPAIVTNIAVVTGDVVDIIGNWSPAAPGNFTAHNSYTASMTNFATTINGVPHTIQRVGWQWDIGVSPLTGTYLTPTAGQMGRINMYVGGGSGTVVGTNTTLGTGCVQTFNSFYELHSNSTLASAALSGNTLFLTPSGNGYQGTWGPGTAAALFVPPVAPTTLAVLDDNVVPVVPSVPLQTPYGPQATLQVSGNAIIGFGAGALDYPGTASYQPTGAGFLNSAIGGIYAWHDYNSQEAGSGPVLSEEIGGVLYITFNGVESYASPEVANPSTLQFQLVLATGDVRIVWVSVDNNASSIYGSMHLVGVTGPGNSNDPGSVAIATATSAQLLTQADYGGLHLVGLTRPIINTAWNLNTTDIPATGVLGIEILGLADPGINDLSFLGMPTCGLRAGLDALNAFVVGGATHAWSLNVPNNVALLNLHVFATSAIAQVPPVNAFGFITSNGIDGRIGDF